MNVANNPVKKVSLYLKIVIAIISIGLWIVAAILPSFVTNANTANYLGIMCFVFGPFLFISMPIIFIIWLSNIITLAAFLLLCINQYKVGLIIVVIALLSSAGALFFVHQLPINENGDFTAVTPTIGVYLWIASIAVMTIGLVVSIIISRFASNKVRQQK